MDYISANLPAIQLDETRDFYSALGFQCTYFSADWMILEQGSLKLKFFIILSLIHRHLGTVLVFGCGI